MRKALVTLLVLTACSSGEAAPEEPAPPGFRDVATEVGIDYRHGAFNWEVTPDPAAMMSGGLCWIDYDSDGWLDLFVVNTWAEREWGRWQEAGGLPTTKLYRNREGRFEDVTEDAGVAFEIRGQGCVAADLDSDGHPDLYVTTAREDLLLWNEGNGSFTEAAQSSGTDVYGWHGGAAAGDVNGDGLVDLFVAGYVDPNAPNPDAVGGFPNSFRPRRDLLYLNEGPGPDGHATFREVGEIVGLETAELEYGLGAVLSDLDGDGDLDLFVANDTNPNRLYRNEPTPDDPEGIGMRFVDVTDAAGVGDINSGMGVAAEDYDADGAPDLVVTNLGSQLHSVYRNQRSLAFSPGQDGLGLPSFGVGATGWGITWADFDLDGDQDLAIANGFVPLRSDSDRERFIIYEATPDGLVDATERLGLSGLGALHGRGVAAADYDNDGDIDLAITSISDPLILLENTVAGPHWLLVDIGAIPGTVVEITLDDGTTRRCEVLAGSSWLSTEDPRCHFGLGANGGAAEVRVTWPDGAITSVATPPVDEILRVEP